MTDQELARDVTMGVDELLATAQEMSRGDGVMGATQLTYARVFLNRALGHTRQSFIALARDAWDGVLEVRNPR